MRRQSRTRPLLASALALALALGGGAGSLGTAEAKPARHQRAKGPKPAEVTLTEGASVPGVTVAMPPVGLSMEYPVMALDLGEGACPSPAFVSALQQLGSPPLSLAGDSQDMTVPEGALSGPPSSWETATLYTLRASFWSQLHCLLNSTHDPLTVGLNLKTGAPSWAAAMVAGAQSAATNGLDFSLGNEPDLYDLPDYSALAHQQANEEALEANLYLQLAGALEPLLGGTPVIGPELAGPQRWQRELPRVISQLHIGLVGVHAYPLTSCVTPKTATVGGLLTAYAGSEPRRLASVVAAAQAAGVPAILSEANSVSCGGVAGVSNSPASAVWAVRFVLTALKTGFEEVRFHFAGDPYDPFVLSGEQVIARPLDYALIALNQWLPLGATVRTVNGVHGLQATNITSPTGLSTLILDNEHGKPQKVLIRGAASAHAETLSAAQTGLQTKQLTAGRGRIALTVAPSSVVALSAGT
jgi:hypothetical protein